MTAEIHKKLNDDKMYQYLKLNSPWIKELNRNPDSYKKFVDTMKEMYHLKVTHKISNAIDGIGTISNVIQALQ